MATIFKQKYTKKNPTTGERETRESKKWYVRYRDEHGKLRTRAGYTDKAMTKQLATRLERDVMLRREGLADPFEEHRERPLTEHLQDFQESLERKERNESYVKMKVSRVRKGIEICGFKTTGDIEPTSVERWLGSQRKAGKSAQTVNHLLGAMKQFTKFLVANGRVSADPLANLSTKYNVAADRRRERRALAPEELDALLAAARNAQPFRELSGVDRSMLYLTAINTGLRRGELASLRPGSFDLESDPATVRVPAGMSKNRKETLLPLHPAFVVQISEWLEGRPSKRVCWPGTWTERSSQMLQTDLAAAGIPYRDDTGRVFDFHALRHHMVTNLARNGVHPSVAKRLARHSTIELTMNTYTHLDLEEAAAALDQVDAGSLGLGLTPGAQELTPQLTHDSDHGRHSESPLGSDDTGFAPSEGGRKPNARTTLDTPRPRESSPGIEASETGEEPPHSFLNRRSQVRTLSGVPHSSRGGAAAGMW